jgi:hypothetical protein
MPSRLAAVEKLPASTTLTNAAIAPTGAIVLVTCTVIPHFAS